MDIQPIGRRLIVETPPVEEKSAGGVILPQNTTNEAKYAQAEGVIVAIGGDAFTPDGFNTFPEKPTVGDRISFKSFSGSIFEHNSKVYRIMSDSDVMMVMGINVKLKSA